MEMKGNFRTLLRKFCLESTILGLKYFYLYPDRLSRCFWCATMVGVMFLACVLTLRLNARFAEMPTQITIDNQYEPVGSLYYPAITLCSPVQITKSFTRKLNQTLINMASDIDLEKSLPDILGLYEALPNVNESTLASLQSLIDIKNITIAELMSSVAQSCESFLKLCYFEMQAYPNCKSLFLPVLTAEGMCCTFNNIYYFNGKTNERVQNAVSRTVKTPGEGRGLVVITDYDIEDTMKGTILNGGAVKVMLSRSEEFPTDRMSALVDTNTESFHVIAAEYTTCSEEVKSLHFGDRKCYLDHELTLPFFGKYSKSDCDLVCIVQAVQRQCGCLLFYIPHATHHTCNITNIPCVITVKYFSRSMYSCDCLADCEPLKYNADVILGNLNAIPYMLYEPYAGLKFNQSTLILNFFFVNSVYIKKKQETVMSLSILASNLGGVFGLCLGCSFFSSLEIIFYLYSCVKNYFRRGWQRNFIQNIEYKN